MKKSNDTHKKDKPMSVFVQVFILVAIVLCAYFLWLAIMGIFKPNWEVAKIITISVGVVMAVAEILSGFVFVAKYKSPEKNLKELWEDFLNKRRDRTARHEKEKTEKTPKYSENEFDRESAEKAHETKSSNSDEFHKNFENLVGMFESNVSHFCNSKKKNESRKTREFISRIAYNAILISIGVGSVVFVVWNFETRTGEDMMILSNALTSAGGIFIAVCGIIVTNKDVKQSEYYDKWIDEDRNSEMFYLDILAQLKTVKESGIRKKKEVVAGILSKIEERISASTIIAKARTVADMFK